MPKLVAIHQPNFFPWLGFIDKMARADIFIFLDNVQFPKTGGTWINRVQIMLQRQAGWVTIPMMRSYHGTRRINEMQINNQTDWRRKLLKSIRMSYSRAPHFREAFSWIEALVNNVTDRLADYNITALLSLAKTLEIDANKFVLGSSLGVETQPTAMLIDMVQAVGGTGYLCGGGAAGYQEDEKFAQAGLELIYQGFQHPRYPQVSATEFVPGLSVIDALMNCGFGKTKTLLGY